MNSNYIRTGISLGVLVVAACNTSIIDPIGGAPGGASNSGGSPGVAGRPSEGGAGNGGAGRSNEGGAGRSNEGGGLPGIAGQNEAHGGSDGLADCSEAPSVAEDAITSNQACTQDSDCELFHAPCLFAGNESCGNVYGISKAAHAEVAAAYAEYEACAGECKKGNACAPGKSAYCNSGKCSNTPTACESIATDVPAAIADQHACSLIVRVDSVSLAILGHLLDCGPRNTVDEAGARASANAAAAPDIAGQTLGLGELLSGPAPSDIWLFQQIYGDFGHVSAVSPTTGRTLFWTSLTWGGANRTVAGDRTGPAEAPAAWSTSAIGAGCYVSPTITRRDWDVRVNPSADPIATPELAAARVLTSALVHQVSLRIPLTHVVTIHHGLSANPTAPVSEYVVIVNAFEPVAP